MTGRILLGWPRIDDADCRIVHMFREPVRFGKQLGICVASLIYRDHSHDFFPFKVSQITRRLILNASYDFSSKGGQDNHQPRGTFPKHQEAESNETEPEVRR